MIDEVLETVNAAAYQVSGSHNNEDLVNYLAAYIDLLESYNSLFREDSVLCYLPYPDGVFTVKTFSKIR